MFVVISAVGPHSEQKLSNFGLKISGFFPSAVEASSHIQRVHQLDDSIDRMIAPMNEWLLVPLSRTQIADGEYQTSKIEEMQRKIRDRSKKSMHDFEERKSKLMKGEIKPENNIAPTPKLDAIVEKEDEEEHQKNQMIMGDALQVPGQAFAVASIDWLDNPEHFLVRIESYHSSVTEANESAATAQKYDASHDRYVVEMYKWLALPPDDSQIDKVIYNDEKLDEIMSGYKQNQKDASALLATRVDGSKGEIDVSDKNSVFYSIADEPQLSHPADHIDRLRAEHPDLDDKEIIKMADEIVSEEAKAIELSRRKGKGKI